MHGTCFFHHTFSPFLVLSAPLSRVYRRLRTQLAQQPSPLSTRHIGEQAPIVPEKGPQRLGKGQDEPAIRKFKKDFISEMPSEQDRAFSIAGWSEGETLAGKGAEVVVATLGVGTADACDALEVVIARRESLADTP